MRVTIIHQKPVEKGDRGVFEFFESMELEYDLPFDDVRDNIDGRGPISQGRVCFVSNRVKKCSRRLCVCLALFLCRRVYGSNALVI